MEKLKPMPFGWLCPRCNMLASVARPFFMFKNRGYSVPVPYCQRCKLRYVDGEIIKLAIDLRLGSTYNPQHDGTKEEIAEQLMVWLENSLKLFHPPITPPIFETQYFPFVR